jgi:hypothetical protein
MLIEARILRQKLDDSLAIEILIDSASDIGLQMNRIRSNSLVFEFDLKLFRTKLNSN